MLGTSQQRYFRKSLLKASTGAPSVSLGRHFSHIFEFTSEDRTFSTSRSYFLSPTCSLLPPSLVLSYSFLLLFPFLQFLWHLTACWVFLGLLTMVSRGSPPLSFTYFCFPPPIFMLFIFLSKLSFISLLMLLLRINVGFHWEYKQGPATFQKYFEVLSGCLFVPRLSFFVGTLRIIWHEPLLLLLLSC